MIGSRLGFVYIMRNPAYPGLVKIGKTEQLTEDRAKKLSSEAVLEPWEPLFGALTMRCHEGEAMAHRRLAAHRVSPRKEFFRVALDVAIETVRECILEVDGIDAWEVGSINMVQAEQRILLALNRDDVFVHLAQPEPWRNRWEVLDLWQAHSDGDQLEIFGTDVAEEVAGFSDGDHDGYHDPLPFLGRTGNMHNGLLIGLERLAPGDRVLWMQDRDDQASCRSVLFEASAHCQVSSRTWSPRRAETGLPLILTDLMREPSAGMALATQLACRLPGPRSWAARPPTRELSAPPLPSPEHWLPQLRPNVRRRQR